MVGGAVRSLEPCALRCPHHRAAVQTPKEIPRHARSCGHTKRRAVYKMQPWRNAAKACQRSEELLSRLNRNETDTNHAKTERQNWTTN